MISESLALAQDSMYRQAGLTFDTGSVETKSFPGARDPGDYDDNYIHHSLLAPGHSKLLHTRIFDITFCEALEPSIGPTVGAYDPRLDF